MKKELSPWETFSKQWKGIVRDLASTEIEPLPRLSTGHRALDTMLGGGIPVGRITEVFGTESSGKSTLALQVAARVTQNGETVLYIDAEQSFDPVYAEALGVVKEKFLLAQSGDKDGEELTLEHALKMTWDAGRSETISLVIWDSLAALPTQTQSDGEFGAPQMGRGAQILSQEIRRLVPVLRSKNCTLLVVNQIRQKLGVVYGNPEYQPGGNAMKFYASLRLQLRKKGGESGKITEEGEQTGHLVTASVVKNKTATPQGNTVLRLVWMHGFVENEKDDAG